MCERKVAVLGALGLVLVVGCAGTVGSGAGVSQVGDGPNTSSDMTGTGSAGATSGGGGSSTGGTGNASGAGGSTGAADAGGAVAQDSGPPGPTAPEPGVMFPFPQNRRYPNCTYPSFRDADVVAAYDTWKSTLVTSDGAKGYRRVARSQSEALPGHTVSEGIGYGMILAVYMNDQSLFDDLWHYEQLFLDSHNLMTWDIDPSGNPAGTGAATDGDEDMAWALLMADRQWSTSPTLGAYLPIAKTQIGNIWAGEIYQGKLPNLGDSWGDWNSLDISYFAPAYYRVFATVDPGDDWAATIQTTYDTITNNLIAANGNQDNGLVPGFSSSQGGPPQQAGTTNPFTYQYDACRTPFRIGLDWCFNGEPSAKAYVALTSNFFSGVGVAHMVDGYQLNGTPTGSAPASPFVGPAGVGAMNSASYAPFVEDAYDFLLSNPQQGGQYYAESWTVLSLLMMSGNFVDYTNVP